jgi:hypothetical protein
VNPILKRSLKLLFIAILVTALQVITACASDSFKTIQNTGGGTIVYGPLSGQLGYQAALGETLKEVEASYGDKPQMGNLLQSKSGSFWEGFFSITDKKHNGTKMTGLVIIYAPPSGTAGGATLVDTSDNFPKSVNTMFQRLVQELTNRAKAATTAGSSGGSAPAAAAASAAPAAALNQMVFPDGSARIGLPQGWNVAHAQQGDVAATGPNGENLRFGLRIFAVNATAGRGGMMHIPYTADAGTTFTEIMTQAAQSQRQQPPTINILQSQDNGPQSFTVYASVDKHDGQPPQTMIAHFARSPMMMNEFQITLYDIGGPQATMEGESSTIAAIFSSYTQNNQRMMAITNAQIQQGFAQEKAAIDTVNQYTESSDRMTQGMSDFLRGESVLVDNDTGTHYRGPDDLAGALSNANPNRFTTLSPGQYIQGVDF